MVELSEQLSATALVLLFASIVCCFIGGVIASVVDYGQWYLRLFWIIPALLFTTCVAMLIASIWV